MKIEGYKYKDGAWIKYSEEVGVSKYLIHLWYSYYTVYSYYRDRLVNWWEERH